MAKKKFRDTKVGQFIKKTAPQVLDVVGDAFPPVDILTNLVYKENPGMSVDERSEFLEAVEQYEQELHYHLENTKNARGIYNASKDVTDELANRIMTWNLPIIILLVVINIACVKFLESTLLAIVSNVLGMVMQKLFEERSAVTNFYLGSSKGSKDKDNLKKM